jgi:putative transposase
MRYEPETHHRRSIRLKGYDYSAAGAYFITICVQGRECLFGKPVEGEMVLNAAQRLALPASAMPKDRGAASRGAASSAPTTLGDIVRAFKSVSAIDVNRMTGRIGSPLWQRNYYERILRDENALSVARKYIRENSAKWGTDKENPANVGPERV